MVNHKIYYNIISIKAFFKFCCFLCIIILYATIKTTAQNIHQPAYDSILKNVLNEDQSIRKKIDSIQQKGVDNLDALIPLYKNMAIQDIENQRIAFPILEKYLAEEIALSHNSLSALYYVIQHADGADQEKYKHFIDIIFRQKIISNIEYGWFTDRLRAHQNKAQLYGFQCHVNADTNDPFPYPILTSAKENRKKLGINPIEMEKELSSQFTDDYKPIYINPSQYVII